jgi:hypothetical protein
VAALNQHIARLDLEGASQHAQEFFVGRPVNRRRGHTHAQSPVVLSGDATARGSRDNSHREMERALAF